MARAPHITCSICRVSLHTYAYDYHYHNSQRKPFPQNSVRCKGCNGTGLVHGAQEHVLGGRIIRCPSCGGHGLTRATASARPAPHGGVSLLKPDSNPVSPPPDHERLREAVGDAEKRAEEEERALRLREQVHEVGYTDNQDISPPVTYPDAMDNLWDDVDSPHGEPRSRQTAGRERHDVGNQAILAPGMQRDTVEQVLDEREQWWNEVGRRAQRRGRIRRLFRRLFTTILLILVGGAIALFLTQGSLDGVLDSLGDFWDDPGITIPGGASEQPGTDGQGSDPPSAAIPPAASPTPTATPTAVPAPTPIPVSPWAGFSITTETMGKEVLDRLSGEEKDCLAYTNGEGFLEHFEEYPLGIRIDANPPVKDVSDLPELEGCLSEESAAYLNRAIALFHDPTLALPEPTPAVTIPPTPVTPPTATPRPTATPTPTPAPRPAETPARGSARWVTALEARIHQLVNVERSTPLEYDATLASIARSHSTDMAQSSYFSHENLQGQSPTDRGAAVGYNCRKDYGSYYTYGLAENIYQAWLYSQYWTLNGAIVRKDYYTLDELAMLVVDGWMDSPGHRQNIVNTSYDLQGIGVAIASNEAVYVTQNFC